MDKERAKGLNEAGADRPIKSSAMTGGKGNPADSKVDKKAPNFAGETKEFVQTAVAQGHGENENKPDASKR